jgi:phosphoglycolate phosphatase
MRTRLAIFDFDGTLAHGAGIAFGAVSWGYTNPEALRAHAPQEVFSSPEEILRKLTE